MAALFFNAPEPATPLHKNDPFAELGPHTYEKLNEMVAYEN